ncbi:MAG: carotenoid biosynthesis protein [Chitinophagaceae bacterium]
MSSNLQSFLPSYFLPRWSLRLSVFLLLLVHISGAIGIAFFNREFFVGYTPLNLLLMFILLLWNENELLPSLFKAFLIAYGAGLFTEIIGVNTGILFGSYHYGDVFGEKIIGVPLLIGLNWFCIVYAAYQVVMLLQKSWQLNKVGIASITAVLATIFDWIMEPVAIKLGFWQWHTTHIPFLNYACWFGISFIIALFFQRTGVKKSNLFAVYLFITQFLFFLFLGFADS